MRKLASLTSSLLIGLSFGGCTGSVSNEARVNVRIIHDQPLMRSGLKAQNAGDPVTGLSEGFCYALMVSSSDGNAQLDRAEISKDEYNVAPACAYNPRRLGKIRGLYKVGDTADISVPVGEARQFYLLGIPKTDLMQNCTAALTLDPNPAKEGGDIDVKIGGTSIEHFPVRLMAYAKANVGRVTSTVDMRMVNDAAGLDLDECGNESLETVPSLSSDGTTTRLNISKGLIQPFIQVRCPSNATRVSVGSVTKDCSERPLFLLPAIAATVNVELKLSNANGPVGVNQRIYGASGESFRPVSSIVFQVPGLATGSDGYLAVQTPGGSADFNPCLYNSTNYSCEISYADSQGLLAAVQIDPIPTAGAVVLTSHLFDNFRSNNGDTAISLTDVQESSPVTGHLENFHQAIHANGNYFLPIGTNYINAATNAYALSLFPIGLDLMSPNYFNSPMVNSTFRFEAPVVQTEMVDDRIVFLTKSTLTLSSAIDLNQSSSKSFHPPDESIGTSSQQLNRAIASSFDLITNRYHVVRNIDTTPFLADIIECTRGTNCESPLNAANPEKIARIGFSRSGSFAFSTYQAADGRDHLMTLFKVGNGSPENNEYPQMFDAILSSFSYSVGLNSPTSTNALKLNTDFQPTTSIPLGVRSRDFFVDDHSNERNFNFVMPLVDAESSQGQFIAGGSYFDGGTYHSFIVRSPNWGKTWFQVYSGDPSTDITQAVQINLPGRKSDLPEAGFLFLESNTATDEHRLLLQQNGDGF